MSEAQAALWCGLGLLEKLNFNKITATCLEIIKHCSFFPLASATEVSIQPKHCLLVSVDVLQNLFLFFVGFFVCCHCFVCILFIFCFWFICFFMIPNVIKWGRGYPSHKKKNPNLYLGLSDFFSPSSYFHQVCWGKRCQMIHLASVHISS